MGVFGDTLRQARAHKGVTLREAEVATRIKRHWLLALEEEHFDQLPALIYQRGIVRNYATYLNLDKVKLLQLFTEAHGGPIEDLPAVNATPTMVATAGSFVPNFAVIAFVLVAMSAAFVWGYSAYFNSGQGDGGAINAIATATPLGDEERFIATATAIPPTPTAKPEVTATAKGTGSPDNIQITDASAAATGDSNMLSGSDTSGDEIVESETADQSVGDSTSIDASGSADDAQGTISYSFYAITDVDLLVVADNNEGEKIKK